MVTGRNGTTHQNVRSHVVKEVLSNRNVNVISQLGSVWITVLAMIRKWYLATIQFLVQVKDIRYFE